MTTPSSGTIGRSHSRSVNRVPFLLFSDLHINYPTILIRLCLDFARCTRVKLLNSRSETGAFKKGLPSTSSRPLDSPCGRSFSSLVLHWSSCPMLHITCVRTRITAAHTPDSFAVSLQEHRSDGASLAGSTKYYLYFDFFKSSYYT
jgi:hypothetical protein